MYGEGKFGVEGGGGGGGGRFRSGGDRGFGRRGFGRREGFRREGPPAREREAPQREGPEEHEIAGPHITRVVVPGEKISDSPRPVQFAFVDEGRTYSSILGLYDESAGRLVPLEGCYLPALDDYVVGVVKEVKFSGYNLDINSPYVGFLSGKETRDEFDLGDVIYAKVKDVDEVKNVDLSDARKLESGEIVEVLSVKIPRIIGKKSSMISMLMGATKSEICVGRNGRLWVKGGNSALAVAAVLKIAKEAHLPGLTDRMSAFLKQQA